MSKKYFLGIFLGFGIVAIILTSIFYVTGQFKIVEAVFFGKATTAGAQVNGAEGILLGCQMPVKFLDVNGDGHVENLTNAVNGEIIFIFSTPIPMPKKGEKVILNGELILFGRKMQTPQTVLIN
jgi:hypothetical protein